MAAVAPAAAAQKARRQRSQRRPLAPPAHIAQGSALHRSSAPSSLSARSPAAVCAGADNFACAVRSVLELFIAFCDSMPVSSNQHLQQRVVSFTRARC